MSLLKDYPMLRKKKKKEMFLNPSNLLYDVEQMRIFNKAEKLSLQIISLITGILYRKNENS
jgi:hypothetical protein